MRFLIMVFNMNFKILIITAGDGFMNTNPNVFAPEANPNIFATETNPLDAIVGNVYCFDN